MIALSVRGQCKRGQCETAGKALSAAASGALIEGGAVPAAVAGRRSVSRYSQWPSSTRERLLAVKKTRGFGGCVARGSKMYFVTQVLQKYDPAALRLRGSFGWP